MTARVEHKHPIGYGPEYDAAWDAMTTKPGYWGMAPIHHGVFENAWRSALEGTVQEIRELAVYDETPHPDTKETP